MEDNLFYKNNLSLQLQKAQAIQIFILRFMIIFALEMQLRCIKNEVSQNRGTQGFVKQTKGNKIKGMADHQIN